MVLMISRGETTLQGKLIYARAIQRLEGAVAMWNEMI